MQIPTSTYRVQLHKDFTFRHLEEIIGYLNELGISTIYASPITKALPGSIHGYDVTDAECINPEIGSYRELRSVACKLQKSGMTWLQDIVPNHMAFSPHNRWLMDVMERGPSSRYYSFFDIDWQHPSPALNGKLMTPFLGETLQDSLKAKQIQLGISEKGITVNHYDHQYPLSIPAYRIILAESLNDHQTLLHDLTSFLREATVAISLKEWQSFKNKWIEELLANAEKANKIKEIIETVNASEIVLEQVLHKQYYALCSWKDVQQEINYRRFFTINALISLRMEEEKVFDDYHYLPAFLFREQLIQGLRIDHIDGLYDPHQYLKRVRKLFGKECYIIAEKILGSKEDLPGEWPLQGTSGYEFLAPVNRVFTDSNGAKKLLDFYRNLVKDNPSYEQSVFEKKRLILQNYMHGELDNLAHYFQELGLNKKYELSRIKKAIGLMMLSLPVYRIYPEQLPLKEEDLALMKETFKKAIERGSDCKPELEYLLMLFTMPPSDANSQSSIILFLKRIMQFTGPLTAKGVEDTSFYVYNPLISHNEVGDSPGDLSINTSHFHKEMAARFSGTPLSLNASSTHDTKRGEDARIRINVLSEMPEKWTGLVDHWFRVNKACRATLNEQQAPSVNDEYFIYQSILGGFPADAVVTDQWLQRVQEYIMKAVREAKLHSNWEAPVVDYENACTQFIASICKGNSDFLKSFVPFLQEVCQYASIYSIAQVLIKITAPGIPDIYQGCELWDLSFVDPDNRSAVDYPTRIEMLQRITSKENDGNELFFSFLQSHRADGMEKLFVTWKSLQFRGLHAELFSSGQYIPLKVSGKENAAIAYARVFQKNWALIVVPLALATRGNEEASLNYWYDCYIEMPEEAPGEWRNVFTGEMIKAENRVSLAELFRVFPIALLTPVIN